MDARIPVVTVAQPVVAHRLQTMVVDQAAVTAVVAPAAGCFPVLAAEDAATVAEVAATVAVHPATMVAPMAVAVMVAAEAAMVAVAAVAESG